MQLLAANPGIELVSLVQNSSLATFDYEIPLNAAGPITIVVAGYGDSGYVAMDSIRINALIDASLDSITFMPDTMYLFQMERSLFSVTGHFDDGVDRELGWHPDMMYSSSDTAIATFVEPGIVEGIGAGTTTAIATFQGETAEAQIIVSSVRIPTGVDGGLNYNDEKKRMHGLFELDQNFPNPFNAVTTIKYSLYSTSKVELIIYNVMGQKVATLIDGMQCAGTYRVVWNGKNDYGRSVCSGMYLCRLAAGDKMKETMKIILLR